MRVILAVLILAISSQLAYGMQLFAGRPPAAAGGSYSDIVFYNSLETSTTCADCDADKSAEDSTPTCVSGTNISTVIYQVGSNGLDVSTAYDQFEFDIFSADIVDHLSGRIGFYVYFDTTYMHNASLFRVYYDASNYILLSTAISSGNRLRLTYNAGGTATAFNTTVTFSVDTWYFVEAVWNKGGAGNDYQIIVDGGTPATDDTATGTWGGTPTVFEIGEVNGNTSNVFLDQILSSTDPERDLEAIKDLTSFPD